LQNYLIISPEINETYTNLKGDFKIYQIEVQNPYIADNDDSLVIETFDDVEIDYFNSLVILNIFLNNNKERSQQNYGEIITNEDNKLGQFAIYTVIGQEEGPPDMPKHIIMTQKSIVPAKKFKFQ